MGSARTEASFSDFHLSLEFSMEEGVNSGVLVRYPCGLDTRWRLYYLLI